MDTNQEATVTVTAEKDASDQCDQHQPTEVSYGAGVPMPGDNVSQSIDSSDQAEIPSPKTEEIIKDLSKNSDSPSTSAPPISTPDIIVDTSISSSDHSKGDSNTNPLKRPSSQNIEEFESDSSKSMKTGGQNGAQGIKDNVSSSCIEESSIDISPETEEEKAKPTDPLIQKTDESKIPDGSENVVSETKPIETNPDVHEGSEVITENMDCESSQINENTEVATEFLNCNDFSSPAKLLCSTTKPFSDRSSNFLKGCKWAPDGSCLLSNSDDNCLRLFNLPTQLYQGKTDDLNPLESVLCMQEAELIYDFCWYPQMSSSDPSTCCMASTSRDQPIHMWDAFTGQLRCSYRAMDHLDELASARSLAFSPDGSKLYCGFNKMVRIFDVTRPGRYCQKRPTYVKIGQSGIISCVAVNPAMPTVYAAGSYSRSVGLYTEPDGSMMCMFQGQQGGVTHLMFSPDGNRLYSGGRKDPEILCWDMRNPGEMLYTMTRRVTTNQRIYFDIDNTGQYVLSGNQDGTVMVWDTTKEFADDGSQEPTLLPALTYQAHSETVNGISLHPYLPVLATASGQRHFVLPDYGSDGEQSEPEEQDVDNSLKLWWAGPK